MAMLNFNREDSFLPRRDAAVNARQSEILNDINIDTSQFNLDEGRRLSDEEQARDAAIRGVLRDINPPSEAPQAGAFAAGAGGPPAAPQQQPTGYAGRMGDLDTRLSGALADVPGGGTMALETTRENIGLQWNLMKEGLALAERDPAMARQFFAQSGMPVPDDMADLLTNRETRQEFGAILAEAESLYPGQHNAQKAWQYVQGRLSGLIETGSLSGAPTPSGEAPVNMQTLTDGQGNVWNYNPRTGATTPLMAGGQQFSTAGAAEPVGTWRTEETDQGLVLVNDKTGDIRPAQVVQQGEPYTPRSGPPGPQAQDATVTQLTTNQTGGAGDAPAAVQTTEWLARVLAGQEGRTTVTDADRLAAWNLVNTAKDNPTARARVIASLAEALSQTDMGFDMTPDELTAEATRQFDAMAAAGAPMALSGNAGNAGLSDAPPPAPTDPAQREVGKLYTSPNGTVGKWTGQGWEIP